MRLSRLVLIFLFFFGSLNELLAFSNAKLIVKDFNDSDQVIAQSSGAFVLREKASLPSLEVEFPLSQEYKYSESSGASCVREGDKIVANVSADQSFCIYQAEGEIKKIVFSLEIEPPKDKVFVGEVCQEGDIKLSSSFTGKLPDDFFIYLNCVKSSSGMSMHFLYPRDYQLRDSILRETEGKSLNFKSYDLRGFGKISNNNDLVVNKFKMIKGDKVLDYKLIKESFLSVRQSPFEVEFGFGLSSIGYSDGAISSSNLSGIGILSVLYKVWGNLYTRVMGEAEIIELTTQTESTASSNFYYNSKFLAGYRFEFGTSYQLDLGAGLDFSKYSFVIDSIGRVFNRRGFLLDASFRSLKLKRTNYWLQFNYSTFLTTTPNSSLYFQAGKRWGDSKFSYWFAFRSSALSAETNSSDTQSNISAGLLLDF